MIDERIIDFYISTTESSSNKDVCYYSSFNFPAFVYTLGRERWADEEGAPGLRKLFIKLAKFNDPKIKRTLACSIHELAQLLGQDPTESDLVPAMERFLKDPDTRVAALRELHIFLGECTPETRLNFIKYIIVQGEQNETAQGKYDWRTRLVLA